MSVPAIHFDGQLYGLADVSSTNGQPVLRFTVMCKETVQDPSTRRWRTTAEIRIPCVIMRAALAAALAPVLHTGQHLHIHGRWHPGLTGRPEVHVASVTQPLTAVIPAPPVRAKGTRS